MNLDELANCIPDEEFETKESLVHWIADWKENDKTVDDLSLLIEKWHGNVWFNNERTQNIFYEKWSIFKQTAIQNIGGMSMNERLYWFGLFEKYESTDKAGKLQIYHKLKATP